MDGPMSAASVRFRARLAGVFYLITFVTGVLSLVSATGRSVTSLIAAASYVGVTLAFYVLFKPVNRTVSLTAALVSLAGCVMGALGALQIAPLSLNPLMFFGLYCLLIGYLIFQSTFLPRAIGVLMAIGGLGWLTFASSALASRLAPYNFAPGIVAEGSLTVWLLAVGARPRTV